MSFLVFFLKKKQMFSDVNGHTSCVVLMSDSQAYNYPPSINPCSTFSEESESQNVQNCKLGKMNHSRLHTIFERKKHGLLLKQFRKLRGKPYDRILFFFLCFFTYCFYV